MLNNILNDVNTDVVLLRGGGRKNTYKRKKTQKKNLKQPEGSEGISAYWIAAKDWALQFIKLEMTGEP